MLLDLHPRYINTLNDDTFFTEPVGQLLERMLYDYFVSSSVL